MSFVDVICYRTKIINEWSHAWASRKKIQGASFFTLLTHLLPNPQFPLPHDIFANLKSKCVFGWSLLPRVAVSICGQLQQLQQQHLQRQYRRRCCNTLYFVRSTLVYVMRFSTCPRPRPSHIVERSASGRRRCSQQQVCFLRFALKVYQSCPGRFVF